MSRLRDGDLHQCRSTRRAAVKIGGKSATIFIAYPKDSRAPAKVLALMAHLREGFGTPPYWKRWD